MRVLPGGRSQNNPLPELGRAALARSWKQAQMRKDSLWQEERQEYQEWQAYREWQEWQERQETQETTRREMQESCEVAGDG